jgi:hypothetical protein
LLINANPPIRQRATTALTFLFLLLAYREKRMRLKTILIRGSLRVYIQVRTIERKLSGIKGKVSA